MVGYEVAYCGVELGCELVVTVVSLHVVWMWRESWLGDLLDRDRFGAALECLPWWTIYSGLERKWKGEVGYPVKVVTIESKRSCSFA